MLRALSALLAVAGVALFAGINVQPVALRYVLGEIEVPLALALFGAFVAGIVAGLAGAFGLVLRARSAARRARAEARMAVSSTRAGPGGAVS